MRSFTTLVTLAVAFFAAAPVAASAGGIPVPALHKRQQQQRGRPNHADLYGYPHNRERPAPGTPRTPMTPGGFVDTRPPNAGAECTRHSQCSTDVRNARALCQDNACTFSCLSGTYLSEGVCTGQIGGTRCSFDRQCPTAVENATGLCSAGRCNFACNAGFRAAGSACVEGARTCGGQECPSIANGYTTCADNTCTPHCSGHLGYKMYCNADQTVCQCTATENDRNNCGSPGNVCPGGYNGKGRAYCNRGQCELSCHRLSKICPNNGSACYCA